LPAALTVAFGGGMACMYALRGSQRELFMAKELAKG
jgi:hypothetical protein